MLATVDQLLPRVQDLAAPSPHWGASVKSILILTVLGVSTLGPLAYLFFRDWRLERNFRRFWKSNAGPVPDAPLDQTAPPVPPRPTLIKESKERRLAQKPVAPQASPTSNPGSREVVATSLKPPVTTQTATSLRIGTIPPQGETNVGMVHIHAHDEFCEVYIDGLFVGNTPAALALKEGLHAVTVKRTGFSDYCRELYVAKGAQLSFQAVLEKTPTNGHASTVHRPVSKLQS